MLITGCGNLNKIDFVKNHECALKALEGFLILSAVALTIIGAIGLSYNSGSFLGMSGAHLADISDILLRTGYGSLAILIGLEFIISGIRDLRGHQAVRSSSASE